MRTLTFSLVGTPFHAIPDDETSKRISFFLMKRVCIGSGVRVRDPLLGPGLLLAPDEDARDLAQDVGGPWAR